MGRWEGFPRTRDLGGGYLGPVQKVDHAKHRPLPLLTGTLELPLILGSVKLSVQTKSHWQ